MQRTLWVSFQRTLESTSLSSPEHSPSYTLCLVPTCARDHSPTGTRKFKDRCTVGKAQQLRPSSARAANAAAHSSKQHVACSNSYHRDISSIRTVERVPKVLERGKTKVGSPDHSRSIDRSSEKRLSLRETRLRHNAFQKQQQQTATVKGWARRVCRARELTVVVCDVETRGRRAQRRPEKALSWSTAYRGEKRRLFPPRDYYSFGRTTYSRDKGL